MDIQKMCVFYMRMAVRYKGLSARTTNKNHRVQPASLISQIPGKHAVELKPRNKNRVLKTRGDLK